MPSVIRNRSVAAASLWSLLVISVPAQFDPAIKHLAQGIELHHLTDPELLTPAGPVSVWLLRLDPTAVELKAVLANDEVLGTETVGGMAARHAALAAINAGFFLPTGDPAGVMKVAGEVVSDTARARGAIGILPRPGAVSLRYGRLRLSVSVLVRPSPDKVRRIPIDGVDTARARGRLMLYTPAYHADTGTAASGTEWVLEPAAGSGRCADRELVVRAVHANAGSTAIPGDGCVLSYGGLQLPPPLKQLRPGVRVRLDFAYQPDDRDAAPWRRARDIVGGAGLLVRGGTALKEWEVEKLTAGFPETRHPRTMIGTAADGAIWMVVVDGRQPSFSLGMNFAELQALARRLQLVEALNLDGGGSSTMWIQGSVVNRPSDLTGPRKVSDALLVYSRPIR